MTLLPVDSNNNPIPAMRLRSGGAHSIAATATSARNTTAFDADTKIVSVYATVPVYLKMGNSSVSATTADHYFPAETYYDFAIAGDSGAQASHIAVLRASGDGTVYISEKI
jgi:hypothetical protein